MKPKILVIYHANCPDGFGAAWACWRQFGIQAEYLAQHHGVPAPDCTGRIVWIVDFSFDRASMLAMQRQADQVTVLDHHKSAQLELEGLPGVVFDMERSGAGITWDELHGSGTRPWIINYIEDRDIWNLKLDKTLEVNSYLDTVERDFATWDQMFENMTLAQAQQLGVVAQAMKMSYVRAAMKNVRLQSFDGEPLLVVNAGQWGISELLHQVCEENPGQKFVMGWWVRHDGVFQYSLRSPEDGVDVSLIAKRFGGGGHFHAAGFQATVLPHQLT